MVNTLVDTDRLKGKMREKGVSNEYLAAHLQITVSTLYRKLKNGNFIVREAGKIAKLLTLTSSEIMEIFFAAYVA